MTDRNTRIQQMFMSAVELLQQELARQVKDESKIPKPDGPLPYESGELQRSMVSSISPRESFISYRAPYAVLVHDGGYIPTTRRRLKNGRSSLVEGHMKKAQPYLEDAMNTVVGDNLPNYVKGTMNKSGPSLGFVVD